MSDASVRSNSRGNAAPGRAGGGHLATVVFLSRFFGVLCFGLVLSLSVLVLSLIHITKEAEVNSVLVT